MTTMTILKTLMTWVWHKKKKTVGVVVDIIIGVGAVDATVGVVVGEG